MASNQQVKRRPGAGGGGGGGVSQAELTTELAAYAKRPKRFTTTYAAGNISLAASAAAWANVHASGLDVTVTNATAGDLLEVIPSYFLSTISASVFLDVATIVTGSVVNSVSGVAEGAATFGEMGWLVATGITRGVSGSAFYVVQSGDISGGSVLLRPRYRGGDAAFQSTTGQVARLTVINHFQAAA